MKELEFTHRRKNPLTGGWVLMSSQRNNRPRLGADNVFNCSFPYSMGWHNAPATDDDDNQRDLSAETAASILRAASDTHYKFDQQGNSNDKFNQQGNSNDQ